MLGRGQSLLEDLDEPIEVFGVEGLGVEPEAGEDLGAIDPVRARRQILEMVAAADEPVDPIRVELDDDVFAGRRARS